MGTFQKLKLEQYRLRRKVIKKIHSIINWRDKIPYFFNIRKASREDMPDFIIAGLPKCGTVWMVRVLRSDKQFLYVENPFFADKGEIRFFSRNFKFPITQYFQAFNKNRDPSKLAYEKSPDYSTLSRRRIKLIKKLNPDVKIILIFRDPIARAFSNAKMDLFRAGVTLEPQNDELFFQHYKKQSKIYNYKRILENWRAVFPKSQLLILSNEDIGENPEKIIEKIYSFLDRPIHFDHDLNENPNATLSRPMPIFHEEFLKKEFHSDITFWNSNSSTFRLN